MGDAYDYFVKADSVKLTGVDFNGSTAVLDETLEFNFEEIKSKIDDILWKDIVTKKNIMTMEFKTENKGLKDLMEKLTEKKVSPTGRSAQLSHYEDMARRKTVRYEDLVDDYSYYSNQYSGFPPYKPYEPPLLQEQEFYSDSHYKTYSDLGDHMALRIAEDTGQNVNTVLRSLKEARRRGAKQLRVQVLDDSRWHSSAYPKITRHPWEEFWRTFTYKPGFKFSYGYDIDRDQHKVFAQMQVEDIDRHGTFVPVQCYFKLPEWTDEEEAQLFTRNYVIWGLEQHEIDEWMLFNGERVFNPHDPKNAELQIAGS